MYGIETIINLNNEEAVKAEIERANPENGETAQDILERYKNYTSEFEHSYGRKPTLMEFWEYYDDIEQEGE